MTPPTSSTQTTTELERALDELDRLIHRSKALIQHANKPSSDERLRVWESVRGLWKGKIVEDPVVY